MALTWISSLFKNKINKTDSDFNKIMKEMLQKEWRLLLEPVILDPDGENISAWEASITKAILIWQIDLADGGERPIGIGCSCDPLLAIKEAVKSVHRRNR
jgi:hypothetical protein